MSVLDWDINQNEAYGIFNIDQTKANEIFHIISFEVCG